MFLRAIRVILFCLITNISWAMENEGRPGFAAGAAVSIILTILPVKDDGNWVIHHVHIRHDNPRPGVVDKNIVCIFLVSGFLQKSMAQSMYDIFSLFDDMLLIHH